MNRILLVAAAGVGFLLQLALNAYLFRRAFIALRREMRAGLANINHTLVSVLYHKR